MMPAGAFEPLDWDGLREELAAAPAPVVIRVLDSGDEQWYRLIAFVRKTVARLWLLVDGERRSVPEQLVGVTRLGKRQTLLFIDLDGLTVCGEMSSAGDVTLGFAMDEVFNGPKARVIFRLAATAARRMRRPVELMANGGAGRVLFRYRPNIGWERPEERP